MSLEEIAAAIETLPPEDLVRFHEWYTDFVADDWDRQMADDVQSGKLNELIEQAREHKRQRRCTPL